MTYFKDRFDAGRRLAEMFLHLRDARDLVVLGIPRGGVPVAFEIARYLHVPLDVFIVRKLGVPGHEELAMGAISSGGGQVLNVPVVDALGLSRETIEAVANREAKVIKERERKFRFRKETLNLTGKKILLVDDGLATGSTMLAGITALKHLAPAEIIVAVPVAPPSICAEIRAAVDGLVCLYTPEPFFAVGQWYEDFAQVSDEQVCDLLRDSLAPGETAAG